MVWGNWHEPGAETYVVDVQKSLAEREWTKPDF
jgi:hypothetical protein